MNTYDDEAVYQDADIQMAEMEAVGNRFHYWQRRGVCQHGSAAGYLADPCYPEQIGLKPGQVACTEHTSGCNAVFDSDDEWYEAMDAASDGERWV